VVLKRLKLRETYMVWYELLPTGNYGCWKQACN